MQLTVQIEGSERDRIDVICTGLGLDRSEWLRRAIKAALDRADNGDIFYIKK